MPISSGMLLVYGYKLCTLYLGKLVPVFKV